MMQGSQGARWRKNGKRGVSPIIATILLVAITVVLAAVLYVLISGLIRGPGNTPINTAIAVGSAGNPSQSGANPNFVYTYVFTFQSASSGVTALSMKFQVQDSTGANQNIKANTVTLIDVSGCNVATYTFSTGTWAAPGSGACASLTSSSQVASGAQLSLATVASASTTPTLSSLGYSLIISGTGSYSGTYSVGIA